jgi:signal transduction histidine kinase
MSFRDISLRIKITVTLVTVILLLGGVAVLQAQHDLRRILSDELTRRGSAIADDLANRSVDLLLTNDLYALHQLVNSTLTNHDDVRYVMLVDPSGRTLVHTFAEGLPRGLEAANVLPAGARRQVKPLETEEGMIQDVAAPVYGGTGVVRIGMSEAGLDAAVGSLAKRLLALVGVAVLIGIVASYGLATLLTKPIFHLVRAARTVAKGDLTWKTPVSGKDEIGQLGTAFNAMTQELGNSREELTTRNEELNRLYGELQVKDAIRRDLLKKAINAQEEERKRVSRELHDGVAQNLGAVILTLGSVLEGRAGSEPNMMTRLSWCRQLTSSSVKEIREIMMALRPSQLDDLGLIPAIRLYAENHLARQNVKAHLDAVGFSARPLPEIETALFRIVQEALNNVAKHAHARTVSISLARENGRVVVAVSDDGQGFSADKILAMHGGNHALGLRGIEERASLLGGRLDIKSTPGKGTQIVVDVPIYSEEVVSE